MSDVPKLRYVLPRFHHGYTAMMKTLTSSLKYESSDPAKFKFHVIQHGQKFGVASAISGFGISRRTYFNWRRQLKDSNNKLSSLVPRSTAPKRTRRMIVDDRLVLFIKDVRQEYGSVGKYKLKVLLDGYARSLDTSSYGLTKIGKIIKRNHYFYDSPRRTKQLRFQRERVKYAPKILSPGYLEMDSVHVIVVGKHLVFVTVIDLATKVAYTEKVQDASSRSSTIVLSHFLSLHKEIMVHTVQTDNGSEFLGDFHDYLEKKNITHLFSYPRSPRINGVIERFNRTLQEEHVERTKEWWCDQKSASLKLTKYLEWYNSKRPHAALKYKTPLVYLKTFI